MSLFNNALRAEKCIRSHRARVPRLLVLLYEARNVTAYLQAFGDEGDLAEKTIPCDFFCKVYYPLSPGAQYHVS